MPLTTLRFLRSGKNEVARQEFREEGQNLPEKYNGERSEKIIRRRRQVSLGRFQKATVQNSHLPFSSFF